MTLVSVLRAGVIFGCLIVAHEVNAGDLPPDADPESLVDRLVDVSEPDYGYSGSVTGTRFLPQDDAVHGQMALLNRPQPRPSPVLTALVRRGAAAVPTLLRHLDDGRVTAIPAARGMMWSDSPDEYDYNPRTAQVAPIGVNREMGIPQAKSHQITVGDLCFVALGQIVNRDFNATRYQPSGGLVINSPTDSRPLREAARHEFKDFSADKHRRLLIQDFVRSDHGARLIGAYRRLAFYYPENVEDLVLKELSVPTYDVFIVEAFAKRLYREKPESRKKELFEKFVRERGEAYREGLLVQLFSDLGTQISDEAGLHVPPLSEKFDARSLLVQLYGYNRDVKPSVDHYIVSSGEADRARFIQALVHDKSKKIDQKVYEIFQKSGTNDYLALACTKRLIGRGYDSQIRAYCERRLGKDEVYTGEIKETLNRLNALKLHK
ncbi:MAG TPA: hypothetical protein VGZ22_16865 [Isosphaeraceae bacterium]|jgi:hypothetical protein|nr:hypothetical protein [Isosphaeraceae bacterium]